MRGSVAAPPSALPWTASRLAESLLAGNAAEKCLSFGRPESAPS